MNPVYLALVVIFVFLGWLATRPPDKHAQFCAKKMDHDACAVWLAEQVEQDRQNEIIDQYGR